MKKKIFLALFLYFNLYSSDFKSNISLLDFVKKVSLVNNINIYIDEDLDSKKISFYLPNITESDDLFKVFKRTVSKQGLQLNKIGNIYYLKSKLSYKMNNYMIQLKYNSFSDIDKYLSMYDNLSYMHIPSSNKLFIYCNYKDIEKYKSDIFNIDVLKNQVILKITIFEHGNNLLKDIGFKSEFISASSKSDFINGIVFPFSTISPYISSLDFKSVLNLMSEDKNIKILQNPFILVKHNEKFLFSAVDNIPYLEKNISIESTNKSEENSIIYKDVGLKINGFALIYNDYVSLDINLIVEDIISNTDFTPTTFKRTLTSNTNLQFGSVLLLTGIKQVKNENITYSVPFISNIPYFGEIFKYKTIKEKILNITIAIEVIKDNTTNHFNIINHLNDYNSSVLDAGIP